MKANREILEDHLERYEKQLASLNSYIKELKDMTARHSTEKEHFGEDLMEAEHNVKYYEDEIARIKKEIKNLPYGQGRKDSILPRTAKQCINSAIISSISFVAGAVLGSRLKSRKGGKETPGETKESQ
jgi:hypothetical protein